MQYTLVATIAITSGMMQKPIENSSHDLPFRRILKVSVFVRLLVFWMSMLFKSVAGSAALLCLLGLGLM
jgi:hypothetical protein